MFTQAIHLFAVTGLIFLFSTGSTVAWAETRDNTVQESATLNLKDSGYRGIWYMNQPSGDEYVYKYSGGLGTYCAKHRPFAVYCPQVNKTFFCYGGTSKGSNRELLHMVSYYDHTARRVPRPTVLLDKYTEDAHDNPVISVDDDGCIWIFSTSHGVSRPSYIHKSRQPYDIDEFIRIHPTKIENGIRVPMTNFSYTQVWHVPGNGFFAFFTYYMQREKQTIGAQFDAKTAEYSNVRTIRYMTSPDGAEWSDWRIIASMDEGHYQISAVDGQKLGSVFNYHPKGKGLNWRTNLYYVETEDFGETWHTADGSPLDLPVTEKNSPSLIHDWETEGLNVYLKDIRYDAKVRPVILVITSKGYEAGPRNDPRTWTTVRWTGSEWDIRPAFTSDNNYDMGSLYIEDDGSWVIIGPTETGPQPYNPGGEVAMWKSTDKGASWTKVKDLTHGSQRNHTYVRRAVDPNPGFYAFWADGHGRQPSKSSLYFSDNNGTVRMLPGFMENEYAEPEIVK